MSRYGWQLDPPDEGLFREPEPEQFRCEECGEAFPVSEERSWTSSLTTMPVCVECLDHLQRAQRERVKREQAWAEEPERGHKERLEEGAGR